MAEHKLSLVPTVISWASPSYEKIERGSGEWNYIHLSPWNACGIIERDTLLTTKYTFTQGIL